MLGRSHTFDLDEYLTRIAYTGRRTAALETLEGVLLAHAQRIPFENLDPLLGWPVRLDADSLQRKIVRDSRGGYCFEQNLLLAHALGALGFEVTGLAARVLWNQPEGAWTTRSHMLLLVDLDDKAYLADVGFGGPTPTGPLRLQQGIHQATPHEPFRVIRTRTDFVVQASIRGAWQSLYRFDLQEQCLADYEMASWYLTHHPRSPFVTGLMAARPDSDRRFALRNNELAIHYIDGRTDRRRLIDGSELQRTLEDVFHLTLPDVPELHATLERLVARAA